MSTPVALITGGASGIGFAVAEHLVQFHGYKVAICDIVEARVKSQSAALGPEHCLGLCVDVTDYDTLAKAFVQTYEWAGNRLDLVYLNAGIGDTDSLYKDLNIDSQTGLPKPVNLKVLDVNLNAVINGINLARHFFLEKMQTRGGKIVVTSSVLGIYPNHSLPLYVASKHALVGLVRSLAPVYAKDHISINALSPTLVETNLMPEAIRPLWDRSQLTPLGTALKAFDQILAGSGGKVMMTGQVLELSLDEVVGKSRPEFSTANIKWMCEQGALWEAVMEPHLPRKPGENAVYDESGEGRGKP